MSPHGAPYDRRMLRATDPLPAAPRRIVVAGVSGVGKTTLSRRIAAVTGIEHIEIDALFHGPDVAICRWCACAADRTWSGG